MRVSPEQIMVIDSDNRGNSDNSIIQSIEKEGVLVPLLVTNNNDGTFTLVAGHRRLASAISTSRASACATANSSSVRFRSSGA